MFSEDAKLTIAVGVASPKAPGFDILHVSAHRSIENSATAGSNSVVRQSAYIRCYMLACSLSSQAVTCSASPLPLDTNPKAVPHRSGRPWERRKDDGAFSEPLSILVRTSIPTSSVRSFLAVGVVVGKWATAEIDLRLHTGSTLTESEE